MDDILKSKIAYGFRIHVGNVIRVRREARHLTLKQVAKDIGVSTATMSKYELGEQEIPLSRLIHICYVCGIDMRQLVTKDGLSILDSLISDIEQGQFRLRCVCGTQIYELSYNCA